MPNGIDELDGARLCFEKGHYASATGSAWYCVTRALGVARNLYLTQEDLARQKLNITDDSSQSKVYALLAKTLGFEDQLTIDEMDRLLQQQITADFSVDELTAEFAREAIERAQSIIATLDELIDRVQVQ